jgi:hypothetical protein
MGLVLAFLLFYFASAYDPDCRSPLLEAGLGIGVLLLIGLVLA